MNQRYNSFGDMAEHYASLTSGQDFDSAFTAQIGTAQLSLMEEPTVQDMPDADEARACVEQMIFDLFTIFRETRLEPLGPRLAWGIVNSFHKVAGDIARHEDDAARKLGELARIIDPSEIHAYEIEKQQRLCQSMHEAMAAIECMRDHAAEIYRIETGRPWMATSGSRTGRSLTASQIDARDFLSARQAIKRTAHAPDGPVVILSGGRDWLEHEAIWDRLDHIKARVGQMVLATTAQQAGADAIAAAWAGARGVSLIRFGLDKALGNRAGFERNKALVNLAPVEAIICEGSGLQVNLAQKCRDAGIPLTIYRKSDFAKERAASG